MGDKWTKRFPKKLDIKSNQIKPIMVQKYIRT